jgi:hypothetical protein
VRPPTVAGLGLHRHVADFVEKQRPPLGLLETADRARVGAGESALLVAEQFAFDEVSRDRGHVDGDERAGFAFAVIVQSARDEFFPGARLAGNHHGQIGLHETSERAENVLHRRRTPDERNVFGGLRRVLGRLAPALGLRQGAPDDRHQLLQIEGFRQIFVGPALRGLDGGHEGVLCAHDDDRQIRPHTLDARQQLERVVVGHQHVGDDEITFSGRDPAPKSRDRSCGSHFVAGARQRLIQYRSYRRIVVGDENMPGRHSYTP